jgi:hypothetical protein
MREVAVMQCRGEHEWRATGSIGHGVTYGHVA